MKYIFSIFAFVVAFSLVSPHVFADGLTITASLDTNTLPARSLAPNTQLADLARIDVVATYGDFHLQGIQLGTDVPNGLQNFAEIIVYDVTNSATTIIADYPSQAIQGDIVQFTPRTINYQQNKVYLVRGTLNSSAQGTVRVGFKNLIFTESSVTETGVPIYGNAVILPGATPTPTPSPTPSPAPTPSATPISTPSPSPISRPTPVSRGFVSLATLNLTEGDTISAKSSTDPDIYIANQFGYKRLFLNPVIFSFYGHLGGFANVKNVTSTTRDTLVTSGLFRNCETNDQRVYGLESTGEDAGVLHWVNTSGSQAVTDDSDFFHKVFCINTNEFNWYQKGSDYASVNQVPVYSR